MSRSLTAPQRNAALQTFVGDLYAAIYDVPWSWSPYGHYTDLDMEPHRLSRIITLDMQIEGNVVVNRTSVLFYLKQRAKRRTAIIAFNDVGEPIFSSYVLNQEMLLVRPELSIT